MAFFISCPFFEFFFDLCNTVVLHGKHIERQPVKHVQYCTRKTAHWVSSSNTLIPDVLSRSADMTGGYLPLKRSKLAAAFFLCL